MLPRVSQRRHLTSSQPYPPLRHCAIVGDGWAGRQRRPARTDDDAVGHAEPSAVFGHQPAYISSAGSSTRCRGLNISSEGAAIDVPNPAYVPNRFRLMAERDCLTRNRRIVWIKQNQIGVMFER
jgi:hypothetical protein